MMIIQSIFIGNVWVSKSQLGYRGQTTLKMTFKEVNGQWVSGQSSEASYNIICNRFWLIIE